MQPGFETSRRDFMKLTGVGAGAALLASAIHPAVATNSIAAGRVPPYRVGKWLPSDQACLDRWLAARLQDVPPRIVTVKG